LRFFNVENLPDLRDGLELKKQLLLCVTLNRIENLRDVHRELWNMATMVQMNEQITGAQQDKLWGLTANLESEEIAVIAEGMGREVDEEEEEQSMTSQLIDGGLTLNEIRDGVYCLHKAELVAAAEGLEIPHKGVSADALRSKILNEFGIGDKGVIFMTGELIQMTGDLTYNYRDELLLNVNTGEWRLVWAGQNKGRDDHIVTDGSREIHVVCRQKMGKPYVYYGILRNETQQVLTAGDHQNNIPTRYFYHLDTTSDRLRVPFKTVLSRDDRLGAGPGILQKSATKQLGLRILFAPKGIYSAH
jgi:hypothetical protein